MNTCKVDFPHAMFDPENQIQYWKAWHTQFKILRDCIISQSKLGVFRQLRRKCPVLAQVDNKFIWDYNQQSRSQSYEVSP